LDKSRQSTASLSELDSEDVISFVTLLEALDARNQRGH